MKIDQKSISEDSFFVEWLDRQLDEQYTNTQFGVKLISSDSGVFTTKPSSLAVCHVP